MGPLQFNNTTGRCLPHARKRLPRLSVVPAAWCGGANDDNASQQRNMDRRHDRRRAARRRHFVPRGFTLVELVVSMAATAILLAGLFVALGVSAKALSPSMAGNAVVEASEPLADLTADLQLAVDFTERTASAVTFTVADRDGDATAESIRYAWSGTSGQPLTRQYNGGPVHTLLDTVTDFQLQYDVKSVTDNGTTKYYVHSVRIALQPTDNTATRLHSAALLFNVPEVAAP